MLSPTMETWFRDFSLQTPFSEVVRPFGNWLRPGTRPSIDVMEDLVGRFLQHARPRGKPLPTSTALASVSIKPV